MQMLRNPVFWGFLFSLALVALALILGLGEVCDLDNICTQRYGVFMNARPNEIGDTLAGFAGSLAFIWIIVTVLLQSKELAAQREELHLTRIEMSEQKLATQDMARSMKAQAAIFEGEQAEREYSSAHRVLQKRLELNRDCLADLATTNLQAAWLLGITELHVDKDGHRRGNSSMHRELFNAFAKGTSHEEAYRLLLEKSIEGKSKAENKIGPMREADQDFLGFSEALGLLSEILKMEDMLSPEDSLYLSILGVRRTRDNLKRKLEIYGLLK